MPRKTAPNGHRPSNPKKLTNKEQAFVEHYLICWNAADAARRAGYSPHSDRAIGYENLTKPHIKLEVERRIGELKASADEILLRLASHSRGNLDDFLDEFGQIDVARARERGVMPLAKKVRQFTTRISQKDGTEIEKHQIELELYDAQAATVQLAKLMGLFVYRVEIDERWKMEIVAGLKSGTIPPEVVARELPDLATQLFAAAGVSVKSAEAERITDGGT